MGKTDFYAIIKGCRTNVRQPLGYNYDLDVNYY